mmetsp:Transcript_17420/g.41316  ORF Transcript_17420/g.41316 Transcript_17420/m.41316 type:complete len:256 (-) Transcript_17420:2427-3194(-)
MHLDVSMPHSPCPLRGSGTEVAEALREVPLRSELSDSMCMRAMSVHCMLARLRSLCAAAGFSLLAAFLGKLRVPLLTCCGCRGCLGFRGRLGCRCLGGLGSIGFGFLCTLARLRGFNSVLRHVRPCRFCFSLLLCNLVRFLVMRFLHQRGAGPPHLALQLLHLVPQLQLILHLALHALLIPLQPSLELRDLLGAGHEQLVLALPVLLGLLVGHAGGQSAHLQLLHLVILTRPALHFQQLRLELTHAVGQGCLVSG